MKKSEMLGKIWTHLYQQTDLEEEFLEDLSQSLLQLVEDAGMQPPNVCINTDGSFNYNRYSGFIHSAADPYIWEKE